MRHSAGTFTGYDGIQLYCQQWLPEDTPKASIVIAHGVGEHSGRYSTVVDHLVPQGYAIYVHDHRGHGNSSGNKGYIPSWEVYRLDLQAQVKRVEKLANETKIFLFGHSMGGLMVLDYGLHYAGKIAGIIASAPALDTSGASQLLKLAAKILSRITPSLKIKLPVNPEELSRNPTIVQAYRDDPLVHAVNTPRWSTEMMRIIDETQAKASSWQLPLLIYHGETDKVVPIAGSRQFFANLTCSDKQFISYPNGRHETHHEPNAPELFATLNDWLSARL